MHTILEDSRTIIGITNHVEMRDVAWVGHEGVTKIEAYPEPGNGAYVPWFAVWKNGVMVQRISSTAPLSVYY